MPLSTEYSKGKDALREVRKVFSSIPHYHKLANNKFTKKSKQDYIHSQES